MDLAVKSSCRQASFQGLPGVGGLPLSGFLVIPSPGHLGAGRPAKPMAGVSFGLGMVDRASAPCGLSMPWALLSDP